MPSYSFPKQHRLLTPADYKTVFDAAYKIVGHHCVCYIHKNQLPHARLGVITPKKSFKTAVERNKLRRWMREAFRLSQAQLLGLDIIVIPRRNLKPRDPSCSQKLERQWQWLLKEFSSCLST